MMFSQLLCRTQLLKSNYSFLPILAGLYHFAKQVCLSFRVNLLDNGKVRCCSSVSGADSNLESLFYSLKKGQSITLHNINQTFIFRLQKHNSMTKMILIILTGFLWTYNSSQTLLAAFATNCNPSLLVICTLLGVLIIGNEYYALQHLDRNAMSFSSMPLDHYSMEALNEY